MSSHIVSVEHKPSTSTGSPTASLLRGTEAVACAQKEFAARRQAAVQNLKDMEHVLQTSHQASERFIEARRQIQAGQGAEHVQAFAAKQTADDQALERRTAAAQRELRASQREAHRIALQAARETTRSALREVLAATETASPVVQPPIASQSDAANKP